MDHLAPQLAVDRRPGQVQEQLGGPDRAALPSPAARHRQEAGEDAGHLLIRHDLLARVRTTGNYLVLSGSALTLATFAHSQTVMNCPLLLLSA